MAKAIITLEDSIATVDGEQVKGVAIHVDLDDSRDSSESLNVKDMTVAQITAYLMKKSANDVTKAAAAKYKLHRSLDAIFNDSESGDTESETPTNNKDI